MKRFTMIMEPKGFRDLYWCSARSEPMVPQGDHNGEPRCPYCHLDPTDPTTDREHQFICHIEVSPPPLRCACSCDCCRTHR